MMLRFLRRLGFATVVLCSTVISMVGNAEPEAPQQVIVESFLIQIARKDLARLGVDPNSQDLTGTTVPLPRLLLYLTDSGDAKLLVKPKVIALDGEKATVSLGRQVQYMEKVDDNTYAVRTMDQSEGVVLDATPLVREHGKIDLDFKFSMRSIASRVKVEGAESLRVGMPLFNIRETESRIVLDRGEPSIAGAMVTEDTVELLLLQAEILTATGEPIIENGDK